MSKKDREYYIKKYDEYVNEDINPVNRWDYLRGKNGIVVHVFPLSTVRFGVEIKGKMGWSEGFMKGEDENKWGGSGTYHVFNTYDEALDEAIERVDELITKIDNDEKA